jgi:hypothetical protein
MARTPRTLELKDETWRIFDQAGKILQHDEPEETMVVALDLLAKAIQLTSPEHRTVRIFGGERKTVGEPCPTCFHQRNTYGGEAAVRLGMDIPSRASAREP